MSLIIFDYDKLSIESKQYVFDYLKIAVPPGDLELGAQVMLAGCRARLNAERTDYDESGCIAYVLGWAHAMGWIPQPDIDKVVEDGGGHGDAILMRWEFGRLEALEQFCRSRQEIDALWSAPNRTRETAIQSH